MFNLIKYELRKVRTTYAVLLGCILLLEGYFLGSIASKAEVHMLVSAILLMVVAYVCAIIVFVMGVTAYSSELKQKTSYLIFMTPHSAASVMCAKMLYSVVSALFFGGILAVLGWWDFKLLMAEYGEYITMYEFLEMFVAEAGVSLPQLYATVGLSLITVLLNILCALVVAYFAITLSATILQQRKGRGFITLLIYFAINFCLTKLAETYTDPDAVLRGFEDMLPALLPNILQCAAVIAASIFGSAWLLEKKVSL